MSSTVSATTSAAKLFDGDFGAGDGAAAEQADAALLEPDDAVTGGMDSIIAADFGARTAAFAHADLA